MLQRRNGMRSRTRAARIAALRLRQQQLVMRSAEQRVEFARAWRQIEAPMALADRVRSGWLWLRAHPELPLAAALACAVLRPRRAWRWGRRLWWLWRRWQQAQRWLETGR
jgi:hypothetical protein